jgi:hypothetical protein
MPSAALDLVDQRRSLGEIALSTLVRGIERIRMSSEFSKPESDNGVESNCEPDPMKFVGEAAPQC